MKRSTGRRDEEEHKEEEKEEGSGATTHIRGAGRREGSGMSRNNILHEGGRGVRRRTRR